MNQVANTGQGASNGLEALDAVGKELEALRGQVAAIRAICDAGLPDDVLASTIKKLVQDEVGRDAVEGSPGGKERRGAGRGFQGNAPGGRGNQNGHGTTGAGGGTGSRGRGQSAALGQGEASDSRPNLVLLKVQLPGGSATNVSLPRELFDQASEKLGGERSAKRRVRELAVQVPEGAKNRSGLVQELLTKELAG